jgi:acyl-CoA dehydrogenase
MTSVNVDRTESVSEEELTALRGTIRDFLVKHSSEQVARNLADGRDPAHGRAALWTRLQDELGLVSLVLPVQYGGDDAGYAVLRVVLEEHGRALLAGPFLASAVTATATLLACGDDEACARYLPGIGSGETVATAALPVFGQDQEPEELGLRADQDGAGSWTLTGTEWSVPSAVGANLFLLVAATPEGRSLFAVESGAAGLSVTGSDTLDRTRPVGRVDLDGAPARLLGKPGAAATAVEHALDVTAFALAAEQVGAARRCLEATLEYARERRQFGRPIGSFQAVKHRLADMLTRLELADAATEEAALTADRGDPTFSAAAHIAFISASDAFQFVTTEMIQLHGGIGFTWEHAAHRYFRRAKSSENALGGPTRNHERLMTRLDL